MEPLDHIIKFLKETNELAVANSLLLTFAKYSKDLSQYDKLGSLFCEIKNYPSAIKYTEKALTLAANNEAMYSCRANLAKLYNHNNEPNKALLYLKANNEIIPNQYENLLEQVFALFLLNRKEESESLLRELITRTDLPEEIVNRILFNLGTYDLYRGRLQQGLRGFLLTGKKLGIWKDITLPFKFWSGGVTIGMTLIIAAEGGIGDEFINIRFLKYLTELGMQPIWFTSRTDIAKIVTRLGYKAITSIHELDKDMENIQWTYSMSLPVFLDLNEKQLWDGQYLFPDDVMLPFLPKSEKFKIGIRWTGNPEYEQDLHRRLPLCSILEAIPNIDTFELVSLQRDDGIEELDRYITDTYNILDLSSKMVTYEDTLAILNELDIVITSCTSIAHAAAAMNKKVFIIVPITAYYTWASTNDTSTIWYGDNTKILRQVKHKSWKEPLEQLTEFLRLI